ncbi:hypothetical protein [Acaryochloris sp. IP29b_bin.148]|uniref:hypothetical protein n=1 Tax=Acaryochloris sp. IP29b_bin.148 TaxID=2969218 RepID=UPI0026395B39|nr:hypothetical protein [Acaryochloris sp. IP29b_bin.148]
MGKAQFSLVNRGIETLGDWNPQLMREIQGRLKVRSVLLTVFLSLVAQGLFLFWQYRTLDYRWGNCATAEYRKTGLDCFQVSREQYLLVNWQGWWLQVFSWSCIFLMFGLIVGGTFLLISDLSKEDRQGTLTFISLSPQTARTILVGKMLGTPFLLYLAVLLTLPLHYMAGLAAEIPVIRIVGFDVLLLASCCFYYSLALLLGLASNWLNGFQAWLWSAGLVLLLLFLTRNALTHSSIDWLYTLSPSAIFPFIYQDIAPNLTGVNLPFESYRLSDWQWFLVPIGRSGVGLGFFALTHFGLWTWWLWQPLQRRFRNPTVSLLSKKQSYGATACFFVCLLGFSVNSKNILSTSLMMAVILTHFLWFLLMIVLLLPHHQDLEDWARFRGNYPSAQGKAQRFHDLVWANNSPTWIAIAINLGIAGLLIMVWMLSLPSGDSGVGMAGLLFNSTLIVIFTLFNQVMLLRPISNRNLWVTATLLGPTLLPAFILIIFGIIPGQAGGSLILLTPFALAALEETAVTSALLMAGLHFNLLVSLRWLLNRRLDQLGESTTQQLLRGDLKVE